MHTPLRRRRLASSASCLIRYHIMLFSELPCSIHAYAHRFQISIPSYKTIRNPRFHLLVPSMLYVSHSRARPGSPMMYGKKHNSSPNQQETIVRMGVPHPQKPSSSPVSMPLLNPILLVLSKPASVSSSNDENPPPSPKPPASPPNPVR